MLASARAGTLTLVLLVGTLSVAAQGAHAASLPPPNPHAILAVTAGSALYLLDEVQGQAHALQMLAELLLANPWRGSEVLVQHLANLLAEMLAALNAQLRDLLEVSLVLVTLMAQHLVQLRHAVEGVAIALATALVALLLADPPRPGPFIGHPDVEAFRAALNGAANEAAAYATATAAGARAEGATAVVALAAHASRSLKVLLATASGEAAALLATLADSLQRGIDLALRSAAGGAAFASEEGGALLDQFVRGPGQETVFEAAAVTVNALVLTQLLLFATAALAQAALLWAVAQLTA